MPSHIPSQLKLDSPVYEEDIGDLSPYLVLPSSTSSRASSATINSSIPSSSSFTTDDELDRDISPSNSGTPRKRSFGLHLDPSNSSHSFAKLVTKPHQLAHSQTLPGAPQLEKEDLSSRPLRNEIDALEVDPVSVAKIRRWILGIAVVEFDLDDGPVVDGIYPPLTLLPAETQNIAFCALPDSVQFDQGSQTHSFRIREQFTALSSDKRPPKKDGFIYGFSHFIQRRDPSSKRGYQQRSLVILTQHQFPAFFIHLASIFGPLFEQHGTPMLEAACHNIATWRDPSPGYTLELGFLGSVVHVEIPHSSDAQQLTETSSFNEKYDPRTHILATTAPFIPSPLLLFDASLSNLWSIWECLVLCEPILVFGASPAQTSQAIWWLRDLLRPIPLAGDIRPYFTMQDSDHAQLVNKLPPKAGLLLGATNPFFEKSCVHWPHVLSLGRRIHPRQRSPALGAPAGPAPGWKTKTHKRYISKDRELLKQLEHACSKGNDKTRMEASLNLRRHFLSRSTQLITPLARYLNTLIPSPTEVKRARNASEFPPTPSIPSTAPNHGLRLKPFSPTNFFASLKSHGSLLPFKSTSKRTEFYERWLKSPAFGTWLAQQEQIVQTVLNDPPLSAAPGSAADAVTPTG
ncbi:DUF1630-domain-containing protein [Phlegmacium glaucopus]|nr:DUF1630-domain-containing protein [Phlegmacium glaucopus]